MKERLFHKEQVFYIIMYLVLVKTLA